MEEILCPALSETENAFNRLRGQNSCSQSIFSHTITEPFGLRWISEDLYTELLLKAGSALNSDWVAHGFASEPREPPRTRTLQPFCITELLSVVAICCPSFSQNSAAAHTQLLTYPAEPEPRRSQIVPK